ncbi:hypothetical protein CBER1_11482 [Cercospora berteroae]|uniref:Zn(2)-C6 fungal-type domain-containing protein n=1 Tax=Cercospora berteroae TaxID=357750 RepID=A0A2S6CL43_9PEZI|nr:hypothetical protein CBER1_11482 [Cercospora berteroae]
MRDDVGILNRPPVIEHRPNGLPPAVDNAPAKGFTAVNNGDPHPSSSFRPDGLGPRPITLPPVEHRSHAGGDYHPITSAYQSHSWRPTEPPAMVQAQEDTPRASIEDVSANKRKRADSPAEDHRDISQRGEHVVREGSKSPKRRMVNGSTEHDQASGSRPSREGHEELEDPTAQPRLPTPEERAGVSAPPPAPRPEVEAELRAQVQQHFAAEAQARPERESPQGENLAQQQSHQFSPDQPLGSEDKTKRKRNFSNRTKTGCHTCRSRKKKCDENRPHCQNCMRGGFPCAGYGPKPAGGLKPLTGRNAQAPLQSKHHEIYTPVSGQPYGFDRGLYGETPHHPHPVPASADRYALPQPKPLDPSPSRYAGPRVPIDPRPPLNPEVWHHRHPSQHGERRELPPAPSHYPPPEPLPPPPAPVFGNTYAAPPPPPPPYRNYPHAPHVDPWQAQNPHVYPSHQPNPPTVISSRASAISSGSGSHGTGLPSYLQSSVAHATARDKMLRGERYPHFDDPALRSERNSCRKAVEAYNESCKAVNPSSDAEQERNFLAIYEPKERAWEMRNSRAWEHGPKGSVGSHSLVETPFNCEFGYNIHLGREVLIQQNCTMQDASIIYIGDRTIVGPNVKFYCLTTSVDAQQRKGSRGEFQAGPIRVEEDVVIHADCIILPFRTIGKGAVVGAGSVVTRDVKPYTVVAGNPAKPIRKRKIESGPNADRHCDEIQEQNEAMLKKLLANEVIPRDD